MIKVDNNSDLLIHHFTLTLDIKIPFDFFNNQRYDIIGRYGVKLQTNLLLRIAVVCLIIALFWRIIPWYLFLSFSLDILVSIFGIFSSYFRSSISLLIFFIASLIIFLFNFIPIVLINAMVWNSADNVSLIDIIHSTLHLLWFALEVLCLHMAKKQKRYIKIHKSQLAIAQDRTSQFEGDKQKCIPSFTISIDPPSSNHYLPSISSSSNNNSNANIHNATNSYIDPFTTMMEKGYIDPTMDEYYYHIPNNNKRSSSSSSSYNNKSESIGVMMNCRNTISINNYVNSISIIPSSNIIVVNHVHKDVDDDDDLGDNHQHMTFQAKSMSSSSSASMSCGSSSSSSLSSCVMMEIV
ncbi:hypothetical protein DFA_05473 [Cavenderia fasciculata]|uniref:Transmembrane protein n=1 Tax=Cavenderia fasciculata TaxID=261658 RepID=F4PLB9_CACFS|nr:uncharacterized protein DFA_05473 [Cavenderia fasciculata]EGG23341.1 hypothetical protein DFA_05473 [Cavenderia fasciculata]|eukprot:XP_004361192.1 hypothetical protein DFA_05473 [Cavenderia fasciculata]